MILYFKIHWGEQPRCSLRPSSFSACGTRDSCGPWCPLPLPSGSLHQEHRGARSLLLLQTGCSCLLGAPEEQLPHRFTSPQAEERTEPISQSPWTFQATRTQWKGELVPVIPYVELNSTSACFRMFWQGLILKGCLKDYYFFKLEAYFRYEIVCKLLHTITAEKLSENSKVEF